MATKETAVEESIVSDEMQAAAQADLERLNTKLTEGKPTRRFKREGSQGALYVSEVFPFPEDFNLDNIAPTSYLAQPEGLITGKLDTQEFSVKEALLEGLVFEQPARKLEKGRALRVVKALKPDGQLVQLPFEGQINNMAAGDVVDAIGLRQYQRKGFLLFFNFETFQPVYCFSRECWAAAMVPELVGHYPDHSDVVGSGYCSYAHMIFTEPNLARNAAGMGTFGLNATTSRAWERST